MEEIFENSEIAKKLAEYKLPRYDELMKYDVFMNQLIEILDEYLSIFQVPGEEKLLTPSMINNYVYKQVIDPPTKKKYTKYHIVHLLAIGILKQVLPLSDLAELIRMQQKEYPADIAYNYFCIELEKALHVVFGNRDYAEIDKTQPSKTTSLSKKFRSAAVAFANQIYVKQSIYFDKIHGLC